MTARSVLLVSITATCIAASAQHVGITSTGDCTAIVAGGTYFARQNKSSNKNELFLLESDGTRKGTLYQSRGGIIRDFLVSSDCNFVAVTEYNSETSDESLVLLGLDGQEVLRMPGIQRFAWAPDGKSLAYILGVNSEGGLGFHPSSIWVYRIEESLARRLPCLGYDLAWANHDGNLYVWTGGIRSRAEVYQYDPRSEETKETSHHGCFFSPNGKFYYRPPYEGSAFGLFRSEGDEDIADTLACIEDRTVFWPRGWLNDSILLSPSYTEPVWRDSLVDVRSDTWVAIPGMVITYPIDGTTFKMWSNGAITEVALDSLKFEGAKE